ncbi:MAG: CBS domain-containing protein [Oscillatoriales cyanobacterium]|nr:MAG: CBS domain-containing protein [Oscillatoriales cyanobacterium]
MDLVLCHITVDFDALGAAVGWARLHPGTKIVLAGGAHPGVQAFLALHRDEYPIIERRSVNPNHLRSLVVVDTQQRDRLGKLADWLALPQIQQVTLYDHHLGAGCDIPATNRRVEPVGATTTLIVEELQRADLHPPLRAAEATVMALGIHVDCGSLTYETATARDAAALAWLMAQGASVAAIATYLDPSLSPLLQRLLAEAIDQVHNHPAQTQDIGGQRLTWVLLEADRYVPGLSTVASRLVDTIGIDGLLLGTLYGPKDGSGGLRLSLVGRSRLTGPNWGQLLAPWGGGHAQAAAGTVHWADTSDRAIGRDRAIGCLQSLMTAFQQQIPQPPTAADLMSSPVRTIRPDTSIAEAQRILLRYGHSGLSVVDRAGQLVGIVSRRDLDIALHHGFDHAPVKGYMTSRLRTIAPDTPLSTIESLMVTYDIGRLPVLNQGQLVGIVTRTDVLRRFHRDRTGTTGITGTTGTTGITTAAATVDQLGQLTDLGGNFCPLLSRLTPPLRRLLDRAAALAQDQGWQLYLVGGGVRDLLLDEAQTSLSLSDIDLVVDGCHQARSGEGDGAAVALARALATDYPAARLQVHGQFQTAALLWHKDPLFDSLWVDIATARTEFYPYPAANPEVEASSIQQDLYRRDFTINALAARLTEPNPGELLDFFGGLMDLGDRQVRVLHANSFIEDPTRIYRAVRFAVKLGFAIEPQTERYIRYAMAQLPIAPTDRRRPALETRLKAELKYILQTAYWLPALALLDRLGALACIHPDLRWSRSLRSQLRWVARLGQPLTAAPAGGNITSQRWELQLEALLANLPPVDRRAVGQRLQLPEASLQRLGALVELEQQLPIALAGTPTPSQIAQALDPHDRSLLVLVASRSDRPLRRCLWRYLTHLSQLRSPLDGRDLQQLGYRPGKQFREMLGALRQAVLDDQVGDRTTAIAWVQAHYPLSPPTPDRS